MSTAELELPALKALIQTRLKSFMVYQQERFPLFANGILIALLTLAAVSWAIYQHGFDPDLSAARVLAGYLTLLLTFLLMRFLDEFKDAEDDARYRAYRPVPRGVISLRSIGWLAASSVAAQLILQWLWLPDQLIALMLIYGWLLLMTVEFGVGEWLKQRPLLYAFSHMFIMPLIGCYALGIGANAGFESAAFPALLFTAGFAVEIGRKIRPASAEEEGVETYTARYGINAATGMWLLSVVATVAVGLALLTELRAFPLLAGLMTAWFLGSVVTACQFITRPDVPRANRIEALSGFGCLLVFASISAGVLIQLITEITP